MCIGEDIMTTAQKYRVTRFDLSGKPHVTKMTERQFRKFRAKRLQNIRKVDLGLT